jgi:Ser/Thr protein kinase RdoA (MazF antagonist)
MTLLDARMRACYASIRHPQSKYVGEEDPLRLCQEFVEGYALHGELTEQEMELIPDLINLRIFSNAVFFVGRHLAGEDSLESLTSRAGAYAKRVKWVNANRTAIVNAIKERMAQINA